MMNKREISNKLDKKFLEEIKRNPNSQLSHAYRLGLKTANINLSKSITKIMQENEDLRNAVIDSKKE